MKDRVCSQELLTNLTRTKTIIIRIIHLKKIYIKPFNVHKSVREECRCYLVVAITTRRGAEEITRLTIQTQVHLEKS